MWHDEGFMQHLRAIGRSKVTLEYNKIYLRYFIEYARRHRVYTAEDVTPDLVEKYRAYTRRAFAMRGGRTIMPRTASMRLAIIRRYFTYLCREKHLLINPARYLEVPYIPVTLPEHIFSEAEIQKLMERPDTSTPLGKRDRAILELLYSSGLRRQEAVNLNISDVDVQQGLVLVNQGKNRKDRIVPLGREACRHIREYVIEGRGYFMRRNKWQKPGGLVQEPALILSRYGRRVKTHSLGYMVKKYINEVFPDSKGMNCHSLRHACATHMLRGGAHLRYIQQQLGHNSIVTTELYTHIEIKDLKAAHRKCHPSDKRKMP